MNETRWYHVLAAVVIFLLWVLITFILAITVLGLTLLAFTDTEEEWWKIPRYCMRAVANNNSLDDE